MAGKAVAPDVGEKFEAIVAEADLDLATLGGDCRDIMLDIVKHRPKPWDAMDSAEQQDVVKAIEYATRQMVQRVVDAVRSDEQDGVKGLLESYTEKDGFKVAIKVRTGDNDELDSGHEVLILHRAQGKLVKIVPCSAEDYMGQRADVETPGNQPEMDFADAGDPDDN
jgi:hypothetical protein